MENNSKVLEARKRKGRHRHKLTKARKMLRLLDSQSGGRNVRPGAPVGKHSQHNTMEEMGSNAAPQPQDENSFAVLSVNNTGNSGLSRESTSQNDAKRSRISEHGNSTLEPSPKSILGVLGTLRKSNSAQANENTLTENTDGLSPTNNMHLNGFSELPTIVGQDKSVEIARIRLEGLTLYLASLDARATEVGPAKRRVQKAEVDFNYCLYYPVHSRWIPPPSHPRRKKSAADPQLWGRALWLLIEKSIKNGTLQQVQDGTLVEATIPRRLCMAMEYDQGEKVQDHNDDQELMNSSSSERLGDTSSRSGEEMMINVGDFAENEGSVPEQDHKSEGKYRQEQANLHPDQQMEGYNYENRGISERESSEKRVDSFPNLEVSGSEEGEVAEDFSQPEADDAMQDHSESAGIEGESVGRQQDDGFSIDGPSEAPSRTQALKDLNPELLQKQLRYFHIGKLADEVDLNLSAKCLACGGHCPDVDHCVTLKCNNCGANREHMEALCPTRSRCSRCRKHGHNEKLCPYKLQQPLDEITCDLCRLKGHVEFDCELIWRTSGKTWAQNMVNSAQVLISCYECGTQGHLGNDCPTRWPGKGLGSSSWTMFQRFDAPLTSDIKPPHLQARLKNQPFNSQENVTHLPRKKNPPKTVKKGGEIKIKGLAKEEETIREQQAFLHSRKLPEKPKKIMHINPGVGKGLNKAASPRRQPMSIKQESLHAVPSSYQHAFDPPNGGKEAAFARYNHGNPTYDVQYDRRRDRSTSPHRDNYHPNYRQGRHQPYPRRAPSPPGGARSNDLYTPMPSSARDAIRRHRM